MPNPLLHLSLYFFRFVLCICQLLLLIVCLPLSFGYLSILKILLYILNHLTDGISEYFNESHCKVVRIFVFLHLQVSHGWYLLYLSVSKSNSVDLYRPPALRNNHSNNNNSSSEEAAAANEAIVTSLAAGTATTATTSPTSKESPNR